MYAVRMLFDITRTIGLDTLVYPGDRPHRINRQAAGESGDLPELELGAHTGTHLDAPAHFVEGGATLDQIPLERFFCRAQVIDGRGRSVLSAEILAGSEIHGGEAVLFRTDNEQLPRERFSADYVHLSVDLAERLIEMQVSLVGIDYLSVDSARGPDYPVHTALLGAGLLILEDCDLRAVRPGRYRLTCLPLRLAGTDAAPCRAMLESLRGG